MSRYVIKRYKDATSFLKDTESHLYEQEVFNSMFLCKLHQPVPYHYSALFDTTTQTVVFALYAIQDSFLYTSKLTHNDTIIVDLLVKDLLSTSFPFKFLFAYEPVLSTLTQIIQDHNTDKTLIRMDGMWSHNIRKVHWTPRALQLKSSTILKQATMEDLPVAIKYTKGFLKDTTSVLLMQANAVNATDMCQKELAGGNIYFLYSDGVPVSMAWKRRQLRDGCSVAFVYTPEEHRHQGFGGACVSLCTELLLQEFKYVTLFIKETQDPHQNMYTRLGYQLIGKVGRYAIE